MLTDAQIKEVTVLETTYSKGLKYYQDGSVLSLHYDRKNNSFLAVVRGTYKYYVTVRFNSRNQLDDYSCQCEAFFSYDGACKHIVAVMKAIQADWHKYFGTFQPYETKGPQAAPKLPQGVQSFLDFFSNRTSSSLEEQNTVTAILKPEFNFFLYQDGSKESWLEFTVGSGKMYAVKDLKKLLGTLAKSEEFTFGKNFNLKPGETKFDPKSAALLQFIQTIERDEKQLLQWSGNQAYAYYLNNALAITGRKLRLNNSNLLKFFDLMGEESFVININKTLADVTRIVEGRPPLKLDVTQERDMFRLKLDLKGNVFYGLDADYKYIYHNKLIYRVDPEFSTYIKPLLQGFSQNRNVEMQIPLSQAPLLLSSVVPSLEKIGSVSLAPSIKEKFYRAPLTKHIYLDRAGSGISARVEFKYGQAVVNPAADEQATIFTDKDKILIRQTVEEKEIVDLFLKWGFKKLKEHFLLDSEEKIYDFLQEGLSVLASLAEVYYSEAFRNIRINTSSRVTPAVRLNMDTNLLEMALTYEHLDSKELIALLGAYKLKKKYYRLKDGSFLALDADWLREMAELTENLDLSEKDLKKSIIKLPKYRALYLDSLAKEKNLHLERNNAFKQMIQDIREPRELEYSLPEGIKGQLREYQKTGFKWLKTLASYGLGGILADDMGLGKTLQVLTFLLAEKNNPPRDSAPSLVIAPTSLVYNWQEEAQKFAPELKTTLIVGNQEERQKTIQDLSKTDLAVTSYPLLRRDMELYENLEFKYCILDEAQYIKNPDTLNAKVVKSIKAQGYFALTGTPLENSLTELWSIFDFLMPGYLLSHNKFKNKFETPIIKHQDEKALEDLSRHLKPFILRRTKKEVLQELPPKIESKFTCEMTEEQRKLYTAYLIKAKKEFEEELLAHGFEKSQLKILSLLTRLRQICCHPALFLTNYQGGSGKVEALMELLTNAIGAGHRVLLFSQFTSMLSLLQEELATAQISYYYLDGTTGARERLELVNSFNSGEKEVFLISLKAGGTGLNLTGADMVIHYDPWWNPAVEEQAADRAYRMGQQNTVQVFKMITRDTIEEKIYDLQQKKKELIQAVIRPGENFLSKMSEAEIRALFDI